MFETHVTVDQREAVFARKWAAEKGYDFIDITLANGVFPNQSMFTFPTNGLHVHIPFKTVRIKVEASSVSSLPGRWAYWEHHLTIPTEATYSRPFRDWTMDIALSWKSDLSKAYLSLRGAPNTLHTMYTQVQSLAALMEELSVPIIGSVVEYVITDSNPDLDRGWL